jgi:hypothetical protein
MCDAWYCLKLSDLFSYSKAARSGRGAVIIVSFGLIFTRSCLSILSFSGMLNLAPSLKAVPILYFIDRYQVIQVSVS